MKTFLKLLIGVLLAGGLFTFAFYRTPQERAFTKNLKLAQAGDGPACLAVAQAYANGEGTKQNMDQALEWYQQASARNMAQAAWELAQLYAQGKSVPADLEAALTYLQIAAQDDYAPAQYELGNWYLQGENVTQHTGQALYWFGRAAQNGSATAQAKLEDLGTQEPQLYEKITRWFQTFQTAQQGDPQAQLEIGQSYRQGEPILQDNQQSFSWFEKAWEGSKEQLAQAAYEMASQYQQGDGVDKNEEKAMSLFEKAAALQNPSAQYQMGVFAYGENPARFEDAFAWFSNAATQGHAQAQYMTGFMLLQGQGTAKSVPLAIRFFEQSAEQNDAAAQYVLGQIYTKGLGIKKDIQKGRQWLERAAENGSEAAKALLN